MTGSATRPLTPAEIEPPVGSPGETKYDRNRMDPATLAIAVGTTMDQTCDANRRLRSSVPVLVVGEYGFVVSWSVRSMASLDVRARDHQDSVGEPVFIRLGSFVEWALFFPSSTHVMLL